MEYTIASILSVLIAWITLKIKGRQIFITFVKPIIEDVMKDPLDKMEKKQALTDKAQTDSMNNFRDIMKNEVGAVQTKLGKQIDHAEERIKENNAQVYAKATDLAEIKGSLK